MSRRKSTKRRGLSYCKRVEDVNRIYDRHARTGLSNREIWRRYIYPIYAISERTFYNLIKASADDCKHLDADDLQLMIFFEDENP